MRYVVIGDSMEPMLQEGDKIFANTLIYKIRKPRVNEIILFIHPHYRKKILVKRITRQENDMVWVESDNNTHAHQDSKTFGWIAKKSILGRASFRYWPIYKSLT